MPWKGDRVVMVLFSAKHPSEVKEVHCEELRALGFVPRDEGRVTTVC